MFHLKKYTNSFWELSHLLHTDTILENQKHNFFVITDTKLILPSRCKLQKLNTLLFGVPIAFISHILYFTYYYNHT